MAFSREEIEPRNLTFMYKFKISNYNSFQITTLLLLLSALASPLRHNCLEEILSAMTVKEEGIIAFVPALSVFKDGAILSNIFLSDPDWEEEEEEKILKLGRHPACDIVLDHPSISRWHLQIQLQKSSQELLLTDLSSVNGTFVCGQRATPKLPITLRLNDIFTMGASTRVYKFQWLPYPSEEEEDCPTPPLSRIVSTHEMKYAFNDGNEEQVSMEERHANDVESIFRNLAPSLSDIVPGHEKQECGHNNENEELTSMRKEYFKADESIVLSNLKCGFNYENKGQFSKAEVYDEAIESIPWTLIPTLPRIVSEAHEMKYGFNDENEEQVSMEERHATAAESISRNLAPTLSGIASEHDKQEGGHNDENKELASKQKEYVKADEFIVLRNLIQIPGIVQLPNLADSKKKWHMVVDTGCLIHDESRQALKQLEGIKRTHLIIPRIVIRELDCLKHQNKSRKGKEAQEILRWIEQCMINKGWWVHVQNSAECFSVGDTPLASPRSDLTAGSNDTSASVAFSSYGSFGDAFSPIAEDHVLEYALLYKILANDGHVVLLSNYVALKVKAMAEGMLCENAREFCQSLLSPYSERFLWSESTAHGHNWTDINNSNISKPFGVKRKSTYFGMMGNSLLRHEEPKMKSYEGAKGLKLISLQNSHFDPSASYGI